LGITPFYTKLEIYDPLVRTPFYTTFIEHNLPLLYECKWRHGHVDFSSLEGIIALYENSTPELIAAGWLHYLAFDFWVGCWILREAKSKKIKHLWLIIPLLATFMLGPVGILLYEVTKLFLKIKPQDHALSNHK
tara:strand:- start:598 stop:999 length:402 start_codon:yes stop_codon:yes gene_type:complete